MVDAPPPKQPRHYLRLLVALCLLGGFYPLLDPAMGLGQAGVVAWTGLFWFVLFCALLSTPVGALARRTAWALLGLAVGLGVVALWTHADSQHRDPVHAAVHVAALVVSLLFLSQTTFWILVDLTARGRVDVNKIYAAVCVYILLALIWANVFGILLVFDPVRTLVVVGAPADGSRLFEGPLDSLPTRLYFSFVTLTTVGYGDLAPGNTACRFFAAAEALIGQLYLTVMVARLVGLHISHMRIGFDSQGAFVEREPQP